MRRSVAEATPCGRSGGRARVNRGAAHAAATHKRAVGLGIRIGRTLDRRLAFTTRYDESFFSGGALRARERGGARVRVRGSEEWEERGLSQ